MKIRHLAVAAMVLLVPSACKDWLVEQPQDFFVVQLMPDVILLPTLDVASGTPHSEVLPTRRQFAPWFPTITRHAVAL